MFIVEIRGKKRGKGKERKRRFKGYFVKRERVAAWLEEKGWTERKKKGGWKKGKKTAHIHSFTSPNAD